LNSHGFNTAKRKKERKQTTHLSNDRPNGSATAKERGGKQGAQKDEVAHGKAQKAAKGNAKGRHIWFCVSNVDLFSNLRPQNNLIFTAISCAMPNDCCNVNKHFDAIILTQHLPNNE